jgi:hypothetical protein
MLRRLLVLAWMCITTCSAFAQSLSEPETRAVNELSGEMAECAVYLLISATCLEGNPDPRTPQLIKDLNANASKIGGLAISTGRAVGVTIEGQQARMKLMRDEMMKSLNNNCTNIAVLLEKYSNFCQQLIQDADPRFAELLQQKKCTGSYKC